MTVSIHAPVRERLLTRLRGRGRRGFNSRSREGATLRRGTPLDDDLCFNSRSREGATRRGHACGEARRRVSIHAPVRERREFGGGVAHAPVSIHAPVRERLLGALHPAQDVGVSIHAPVRERRVGAVHPHGVGGAVSIHAPVRERHPRPQGRGRHHRRFNSRSREGATLLRVVRQMRRTRFQFTLP